MVHNSQRKILRLVAIFAGNRVFIPSTWARCGITYQADYSYILFLSSCHNLPMACANYD